MTVRFPPEELAQGGAPLPKSVVTASSLPWADPYNFGYDPLATDNTAALNAAIASLPVNPANNWGGRVIIPAAGMKCAGQVHAANTTGLRLEGSGGPGEPGLGQPRSQLLFTGLGNAVTDSLGRTMHIDARSAAGFVIDGVSVLYNNASFNGVLVNCSHSGGGSDATVTLKNSTFAGVYFDGTHYQLPAAALVSLLNAISSEIDNCFFARAQSGVRGAEYNAGSIGYSNAITIRRSTFIQTVSAITNPYQVWNVENNTFEGLQQAAADYLHNAISTDIAAATGYTIDVLSFIKNWCGDAFGVTNWVKLAVPAHNSAIEKNLIATGNGGIILAGGSVAVRDNDISTSVFSIDFGSASTWSGLVVENNTGVTDANILNKPAMTSNTGSAPLPAFRNNPVDTGVPPTSFSQVPGSQRPVQDISGNYTAQASDAGTLLEFSGASAQTLTIAPHSTKAIPGGSFIDVTVLGAGDVTIAPGAAVTIRNNVVLAQGQSARLIQRLGFDDWFVLPWASGSVNTPNWSRFGPTGSKGETIPGRFPLSTTFTPTSGRLSLFALAVPLVAGKTYSSISFFAGSAVVTPTNQWFTIVDLATLTTLRSTVDDTTTAWGANALKTLNLSSAYTPIANHDVYLGIVVAAATPPQLRGTADLGNFTGAIGPPLNAGSTTGLTGPVADGTAVAAPAANALGTQVYAYIS